MPVLLTSTITRAADLEALGRNLGAAATIAKPFDHVAFLAAGCGASGAWGSVLRPRASMPRNLLFWRGFSSENELNSGSPT